MALTISQGMAVSYPAIIANKRKAHNQWEESAFLHELERQGGVIKKSLGPTIEAPLDYQRNPGAAFLATDLQPTSLSKTEVLTAASYEVAELYVPATWSRKDEVMNPSENQKIDLIAALWDNCIKSHDDMIEQYVFATSTNGFLGLITHVPTAGTGSDGGIDSSTNTWWQSKNSTYVDDTDIESAFTTLWNACSKGSGSSLSPTLMVSDGATQALFEGTQQANQRYINTDELKAGFKILGFKTCRYVFSQYGTSSVYFLNPKNYMLVVSKEAFREKDDTQKLQGVNGYTTGLYSALQTVVTNRSRLGVAHV